MPVVCRLTMPVVCQNENDGQATIANANQTEVQCLKDQSGPTTNDGSSSVELVRAVSCPNPQTSGQKHDELLGFWVSLSHGAPNEQHQSSQSARTRNCRSCWLASQFTMQGFNAATVV